MGDQHKALFIEGLAGGSGGSGGTSDYTQLTNKPQINGTILVGNKTLSDLGIEWVWRGTRAQYEAAAATIPPNTFVEITDETDMDLVPTDGSTNPVESNGIFDALAGKQDTIDSSHKLSADLVDDSASTNKLAHIDNAGGLWVGSTQYIKIMDRASYDALTTKDDMIYMVYPTPSANLNMGASPRGVETLTAEGGDENADIQADDGIDEMR